MPQLAAGYIDRYTRGAAFSFIAGCEPGAIVSRPVVEVADDDDIQLVEVGAVELSLDQARTDMFDRYVTIDGCSVTVEAERPHEDWSFPALGFSPSRRQLRHLRNTISDRSWSLADGLKRDGIAAPPFDDQRTGAMFTTSQWRDANDGATLVLDERGATVSDHAGLYVLPWSIIEAVCTYEASIPAHTGIGIAPTAYWWTGVTAATDAAQRWRRDFSGNGHSFIGVDADEGALSRLGPHDPSEDSPAVWLTEVVGHYRPDLSVQHLAKPG